MHIHYSANEELIKNISNQQYYVYVIMVPLLTLLTFFFVLSIASLIP